MVTKKEIALKLARREGFDNVMLCCHWEKYEVYSVFDDDWDEDNPPCIGLPTFILVSDLDLSSRIASGKEWSMFAHLLPD
jgi:hypothetical protein